MTPVESKPVPYLSLSLPGNRASIHIRSMAQNVILINMTRNISMLQTLFRVLQVLLLYVILILFDSADIGDIRLPASGRKELIGFY